jgi:DNA-binding NtrC family response regulator
MADAAGEAGAHAGSGEVLYTDPNAASADWYAPDLSAPGADRPPAAPDILRFWVAVDPVSLRLAGEIRGIAACGSTVLIAGESGAGKDLLASVLHYLGPHAGEPLVKIDCAGLPRDVVECELFGCCKPGRLELAGAGTVVLDEVAALSMPVQAKLLRVIDEKRFERMDAGHSVPVQARVIALTTVDLEHAVARRTFREDLYYRLNVVPIFVPPLRDRPLDVAPLAEHFLAQLAEIHRKPRLAFAPAALAALEGYSYPGNVRELRSIVERAVIVSAQPQVLPQDLPAHVREASAAGGKVSLEEMERAYITEVLDYTRGKKTLAAQILGISRKTLLEKRKRYGLE